MTNLDKFSRKSADLNKRGTMVQLVMMASILLSATNIFFYFREYPIDWIAYSSALILALSLTFYMVHLLSKTKTFGDEDLAKENELLGSQIQSLEEDLANMKQQMEQLSRFSALGEMAGNMGHEINNQLAVMEGWAEQLASIRNNPERCELDFVEKAGSKIRKQVDRLNKMTKALRNFVRSNNQEKFQEAEIQKIVRDVVNIAEPKTKKNNVLVKTFFEGENLKCYCREVEISQVVLNLVSNAVDAISNQEKPWIQIRVVEKMHDILISVTDSGEGIPPAIVKKIMEPYFTTKEAGKGTGIGLSISADIIKSHWGELEYDPSYQYTRFVIRLPKRHDMDQDMEIEHSA